MYLPIIIIARGGSKRILRKNVKSFCGKPLVEWSIIQAKCARQASEVILSTDDDEIAAIGDRHHIRVLRRPTMPDDTPGSVPMTLALNRLKVEHKFDTNLPILPTNTLRLPNDLDNAISLYYGQKKVMGRYRKTVVAVTANDTEVCEISDKGYCNYMSFRGWPVCYLNVGLLSVEPVWKWKKSETGIYHQADRHAHRRVRRTNRINRDFIPYVVSRWQNIDIDHPDQFELAEHNFQKYILDEGYYK